MEEQHEHLFDLIESKTFEELSKEERSFVLVHLTEAEYNLQRKVIAATAALEYNSEEPLALKLPEKNTPFLKRTIPLHKALIGAACLVLLFVVGNRKSYLEISLTNGASSVQIIHDTLIEKAPFIPASRIIHDTITIVQNALQQTEKRILEAGNTMVYPELTEKLLETKSQSYKEDQTTAFLPSITVVNTMK
jgi:hypothetical protein